MRKDNDLLGELEIPDDVYYGAQTLRTLQLFEPSKEKINEFPSFVYCMGAIKKACAVVNCELGVLEKEKGDAICQACEELMQGKFDDQLVLDMLSGNDFAPIHMNFNEVIACRANEILCGEKGYHLVQPNTHVNMGQSTCDTTYAAVRFALHIELQKVEDTLQKLQQAYQNKANEYENAVKVSHTCFQDAAPISMKQFFGASASFLKRQIVLIQKLEKEALEHAIGYTAIGTGLGSYQGFHEKINPVLSEILGAPTHYVSDPFDDRQYADFFLRVSGALRAAITGISKMARDIRVMSSGPHAGFSELTIQPVQNGSSFFPGKVNPSLAELVNIACYQICGYDTSVMMAVEAGELDVTPWYPVFSVNTLNSCSLICRTVSAFTEKCVATIRMNVDSNREKAEKSQGMAVAASAVFGYKTATQISLYAAEHNLSIKEAVVQKGIMEEEQAAEIFDPLMLTDVKRSSELLLNSARKDRY